MPEALQEEKAIVYQEIMGAYMNKNQIRPKQLLMFGVPGGLRFPNTIRFLLSPCCSNLEFLKLETTELKTLCANRWVEGLNSISSITSLDLTIVTPHPRPCDDLEGVPILIKYLEQESRLKKLSLAHHPDFLMEETSCFTTHGCASALFSALARKEQLVELSLTFTFDLADWDSIKSYLIQSQSLQKLRLDANLSPNSELYSPHLGEGLRQNGSIRSLELITWNIEHDEATPQELSEVINANADRPYLKQLEYLHICNPDDESLRSLGSFLERPDCGLTSFECRGRGMRTGRSHQLPAPLSSTQHKPEKACAEIRMLGVRHGGLRSCIGSFG